METIPFNTVKRPPIPGIKTRMVRLNHLKLALRVDSGLQIGTLHPLRDGRTLLGRAIDAEIPIDDAKASRLHAAIDWSQGCYIITDLGSTNGTFLNGQPVQMGERLTVGDEIRVGSTCFKVEILEEARNQIPKSWVEPTKIVMVPRVDDEQTRMKIRKASEPSQTFKIDYLIRKFKEDRFDFVNRHGGWLGVVFVGIVVATAIAFNDSSLLIRR
jgi:pSer/pThr/pTyr-binding forkhead associated (FHA) protein